MTLGASQYFSIRQLRAVDRLGDIIVPGNQRLPRFSDLGCSEHIDITLTNAHPDDIAALSALLSVLACLPDAGIKGIVRLSAWGAAKPSAFGAPFRMLNTSLRGLIYSLYYSNLTRCSYQGPTPLHVIGGNVYCEPDVDFKPSAPASLHTKD